MARFNVHTNLEGEGYLLDVQSNLMNHLDTRIVVPLLPLHIAPKPSRVLNPVFNVEGAPYQMTTQFLAAIAHRSMGREVQSLQREADTVVSALDCLFQGI